MTKQIRSQKLAQIAKFLNCILVLGVLSLGQALHAADEEATDGIQMKDPGSDLWRNVRQRNMAIDGVGIQVKSQVKATDSNVLINISGEAWRQFRMLELIPKASIAILIALCGVLLFRLIHGKIMIEGGFSGKKILRFTFNQRTAHWTTAILFVVLALTGLILLLGRTYLIPYIGASGFSYIASTAKILHDYLGPAFAVSLIFLFVLFFNGNQIALKRDLQWIIKGGGFFGDKHVSADCYNAGEKGWFWIAALVGGAIIVSGLVLDFPIFDQSRQTMENFHMIHSIAAVIMIIASFGHIYMGTLAMEGTFDVMKTGYCDSNWAKSHHDRWYAKKVAEGKEISGDEVARKKPDTVSDSTESTV